jgi:polyferredoxin
VAVCPTGVDIRDGPNLGCIQCGLCIDACDTVMAKVGHPARLIAYDTDVNIKRREAGQPAIFRIVRARTVLYAAIIAVVGGIMTYALATRRLEGVSVIHDRNPMSVRLSDGALRNAYTIRIVNKRQQTREFSLSLSGLPAGIVDFVGLPPRSDGRLVIEVGPDQTREVRVLVTDYGAGGPESEPVIFRLTDVATGDQVLAGDHFFRD